MQSAMVKAKIAAVYAGALLASGWNSLLDCPAPSNSREWLCGAIAVTGSFESTPKLCNHCHLWMQSGAIELFCGSGDYRTTHYSKNSSNGILYVHEYFARRAAGDEISEIICQDALEDRVHVLENKEAARMTVSD